MIHYFHSESGFDQFERDGSFTRSSVVMNVLPSLSKSSGRVAYLPVSSLILAMVTAKSELR